MSELMLNISHVRYGKYCEEIDEIKEYPGVTLERLLSVVSEILHSPDFNNNDDGIHIITDDEAEPPRPGGPQGARE